MGRLSWGPRPGDAWRVRPGADGSPGVRLTVVLPGHDVLKQLAAGDSAKKAHGVKQRGHLATRASSHGTWAPTAPPS